MKTYLDCIPCFIRQALEAARHVRPTDEVFHRRVLNEVCTAVPRLPEQLSPPRVGEFIHSIIRREPGIEDPYAQAKANNLRQALAFLPRLEAWVRQHADPFEAAIRVAITGNIIDLGASPDFQLEAELDLLERQTSQLDALEPLRNALEDAEQVLYIGDNTAEAVFDQVLIRQLLPRRVFFATRARPILNDITEETARRIGLDADATVLSSGSPIPGTDLARVTEPFRQLLDEAPVVIAKGQGNFESLSDAGRPIFFLFKVKCEVVAALTGRAVGSSILYLGGTMRKSLSAERASTSQEISTQ